MKPLMLVALIAALQAAALFAAAPELPPEAKTLVAEYMKKPENKVFIIAVDPDGRFACGRSSGEPTLQKALLVAVKQCDQERKAKGIAMPRVIYALNNKVVYAEKYERARAKKEDRIAKRRAGSNKKENAGILQGKFRRELALIVVPAEKLPEGCRLAPMDKGSKFLPANPTATEDSRLVPLIAVGIGLFAVADPASVTNDIECAFTAVYHDADGKETGVNLLLFKKGKTAKAYFKKLEPKSSFPLIHGDRYLMGIWTDNPNQELSNWMKAYFHKKGLPKAKE